MSITDSPKFIDAVAHLSGLEFVEIINITWALAKCADESIPEPKKWVRQFDEFPVDEIAPELFDIVTKGVISSKNLKSLLNRTQKAESI